MHASVLPTCQPQVRLLLPVGWPMPSFAQVTCKATKLDGLKKQLVAAIEESWGEHRAKGWPEPVPQPRRPEMDIEEEYSQTFVMCVLDVKVVVYIQVSCLTCSYTRRAQLRMSCLCGAWRPGLSQLPRWADLSSK